MSSALNCFRHFPYISPSGPWPDNTNMSVCLNLLTELIHNPTFALSRLSFVTVPQSTRIDRCCICRGLVKFVCISHSYTILTHGWNYFYFFSLCIVEAMPPPGPREPMSLRPWVYNQEHYEHDYEEPMRPMPIPWLPLGSAPGPVIMPRYWLHCHFTAMIELSRI